MATFELKGTGIIEPHAGGPTTIKLNFIEHS
jgi:hypothetical protein